MTDLASRMMTTFHKKNIWDEFNQMQSELEKNGRKFETNFFGFDGDHSFYGDAIARHADPLIVEVGSFLGRSAMLMAEKMKAAGKQGCVVCVDHWLTDWQHCEEDEFRGLTKHHCGAPTYYYTFMANVVAKGLQDFIVPLRMDAYNAARRLDVLKISPDVIYVDGCHDYDPVVSDLKMYWRVLRNAGVMIVDDYGHRGNPFPGLEKAVNEFVSQNALKMDRVGTKVRFVKP